MATPEAQTHLETGAPKGCAVEAWLGNPAHEIEPDDAKIILLKYMETLDFNDDKEQWFDKVKAICEKNNYAVKMKDYKKNPENYKGSIVHLTGFSGIAVAAKLYRKLKKPDISFTLTGRSRSNGRDQNQFSFW